jgi:hypothetical protein
MSVSTSVPKSSSCRQNGSDQYYPPGTAARRRKRWRPGVSRLCHRPQPATVAAKPAIDPSYRQMYAAMPEERFPIPAVDLTQLDPVYYRRVVEDPTGERPGTVVVDTRDRFLYLVREDGQAMRYGVGIGRAGFAWSGRAMILRKQEWPTWTPPAEMIAREPELEEWRNGMPPGLANPLGARRSTSMRRVSVPSTVCTAPWRCGASATRSPAVVFACLVRTSSISIDAYLSTARLLSFEVTKWHPIA